MSHRHDDTAGRVPEWASMLAPEEWAWFVATLATELERRSVRHDIDMDTGAVHIALEDAGDAPNVVGLATLAQICRARPRDAWAAAIRHQFDVAFETKLDRTPGELAKDWLLARDAVKLRLHLANSLPKVPLVTWEIAAGLVAVLTFDLPNSVVSVRLEDREKWDVSDEEIYAVALANVRGDGLLPGGTVDVGEGSSILVLEGHETFFGASHALFLDEYLGERGRYGAVISVPHRHVVLYHPIRDIRVVRALEAMFVTTASMYSEGPGAISPDLYWLPPDPEGEADLEDLGALAGLADIGDETDLDEDDLDEDDTAPPHLLVRLPFEVVEDTLRFDPPPEFARVLDSLESPPERH